MYFLCPRVVVCDAALYSFFDVVSPLYTLGLTVPLLTTPDGKKFGKSTGAVGKISEMDSSNIWLSSDRLLPYHFYQRLVNLSDAYATSQMMRQLTFLKKDEIVELLADHWVRCSLQKY